MPTSVSSNNLRVEDLTVVYRGLPALSSVSLQVAAGKIVAVLGANGAGKTTLLKAISGSAEPTHGRIFLGEDRIDGLPAYQVARRGVHHLPEARGLFRELSLRENLALAANVLPSREVEERLPAILARFPMLAERASVPTSTLSGGQQQVLAIARALLVKPRLLLVDELSFGLAPMLANQAFDLLAALNRELGSSVLLVEQNVGRALRVCSYAYVLKNGVLAMQGDPESLLSDRRLLYSYLGAEVPAQLKEDTC